VKVQKRNIGFVFQNYALFNTMNVFKKRGLRVEDQEVEEGGHRITRDGVAGVARAQGI